MQGAHEAGALAPLAQGSIGSVPPPSLQRDDSMAELPSAVFCPLPMPPPISVSRSGTPALELMNYGPTPVLPSPAPTPGNPPIPAGRFPRAPALRVEVSLANLRHGPLALPEKTPVASPAPTPTMWPGSGNNGNRFPVAEDVSAPPTGGARSAAAGASSTAAAASASAAVTTPQLSLADRKMAALEEWKTVGREVVSRAQRHLAAVKTTHGKAHSWGGTGKVTCKGGELTLPPMVVPFSRELFEVSVNSILPALAERLAQKRKAEAASPGEEAEAGEDDDEEEGDERLIEEDDEEGWEEPEEEEEGGEEEDGEEGEEGSHDNGDGSGGGGGGGGGEEEEAARQLDVEVPGLLRIAALPRRASLPRKPVASAKEGLLGFFEYKRAQQVAKRAREAEVKAAEAAKRDAERKRIEEEAEAKAAAAGGGGGGGGGGGQPAGRGSRKRRRGGKKPEVDVAAVAKTAGRAARKAVHAQALAEWKAMDDATRAGWAAKEEDQAKAYEAAKEARDAAGGQVPPTEYRMKLRDPSVPQLLMRLPAEGFRAFTTFGVGGQREQRASLLHMSLTYNVQEEQLTVSSCTVAL